MCLKLVLNQKVIKSYLRPLVDLGPHCLFLPTPLAGVVGQQMDIFSSSSSSSFQPPTWRRRRRRGRRNTSPSSSSSFSFSTPLTFQVRWNMGLCHTCNLVYKTMSDTRDSIPWPANHDTGLLTDFTRRDELKLNWILSQCWIRLALTSPIEATSIAQWIGRSEPLLAFSHDIIDTSNNDILFEQLIWPRQGCLHMMCSCDYVMWQRDMTWRCDMTTWHDVTKSHTVPPWGKIYTQGSDSDVISLFGGMPGNLALKQRFLGTGD